MARLILIFFLSTDEADPSLICAVLQVVQVKSPLPAELGSELIQPVVQIVRVQLGYTVVIFRIKRLTSR